MMDSGAISREVGLVPTEWEERHLAYWNEIASRYDQLYAGAWSLLENNDLRGELSWLRDVSRPRVLDLGCGTGLGYELCRDINPDLEYVGLDISPRMLAALREKHPEAHLIEASMSALPTYSTGAFDLVLSLFGALSYSHEPQCTIGEAFRVLRPGGVCFAAALNRWALRRLLRGKMRALAWDRTRGDEAASSLYPAHTFTFRSIRTLFAEAGFRDVRVRGSGLLSGMLERPALYGVDRAVSGRVPLLAHLLHAAGTKPREADHMTERRA